MVIIAPEVHLLSVLSPSTFLILSLPIFTLSCIIGDIEENKLTYLLGKQLRRHGELLRNSSILSLALYRPYSHSRPILALLPLSRIHSIPPIRLSTAQSTFTTPRYRSPALHLPFFTTPSKTILKPSTLLLPCSSSSGISS